MVSLTTLADRGFALRAVLDVGALPNWIAHPIQDADIDLRDSQRLVMLGQGGRGLWETMQAEGFESDDPFDDFSRRCVEEFVAAQGDPAYEMI